MVTLQVTLNQATPVEQKSRDELMLQGICVKDNPDASTPAEGYKKTHLGAAAKVGLVFYRRNARYRAPWLNNTAPLNDVTTRLAK
jgi:hypothetical protein